MKIKRQLISVLLLAAVYIGGYLFVRNSYAEVWERDGATNVLFPNAFVNYLYRPASYLDAKLTGMRFHIGPHQ